MAISLLDTLFWSIPFIATVTITAVLGYLSLIDKSKRRTMFILATCVASFGYYCQMLNRHLGIAFLGSSYRWAFFPLATAIYMAALSSLLKLRSLERIQSKGFLVALAGSIILLVSPTDLDALFFISYSALVTMSLVMLISSVMRRREISDFLFFQALACLSVSTIAIDVGLLEEYSVLLVLFGMESLGLMFAVSKDGHKDGIASFVVLERKLEKAQEDLKTAQEKLLRAERLATIGELAAMVGHDLRNPLQGISNATYYLKKKMGQKMDEEETEMLELIKHEIEYSDKIMSDLLDYSKEIRLELTETTPESIIRESFSMVTIPKNINMSNATQSQSKIKVDVEKMKRAFVNIIKNAIDAMPEGGALEVKSRRSSDQIEFSFSDNGVGMSKDTMERLWTPLFTTKARGMGFGLAICKRIIEAHGGKISVESTVGKGTTFTATIPVEPRLEGGEEEWMKPTRSLLSTTMKA